MNRSTFPVLTLKSLLRFLLLLFLFFLWNIWYCCSHFWYKKWSRICNYIFSICLSICLIPFIEYILLFCGIPDSSYIKFPYVFGPNSWFHGLSILLICLCIHVPISNFLKFRLIMYFKNNDPIRLFWREVMLEDFSSISTVRCFR